MIANVKAFVRLHFGIVLVTLSFLLLATTRLSGKLGQNTTLNTTPKAREKRPGDEVASRIDTSVLFSLV